jgi:glutamate synthase domain-containing protein 3
LWVAWVKRLCIRTHLSDRRSMRSRSTDMADLRLLTSLACARSIDVDEVVEIDARGVPYRELNARLAELVEQGVRRLIVRSVCGQRYLGTSLHAPVSVVIEGVPGNDLGAFMDGPLIEVMNDAQDGCGNTMNSGLLAIHGSVGDIVGHSMRGGTILVNGNAGYRAGIHMKEYGETRPAIVIGGTAQHFAGEYMAGGVVIMLGMNLGPDEMHPARYIGTGMHGGVIYLRGEVESRQLGKEVGVSELEEKDWRLVRSLVGEYANYFDKDAVEILRGRFQKLSPQSLRPYGRLYAY